MVMVMIRVFHLLYRPLFLFMRCMDQGKVVEVSGVCYRRKAISFEKKGNGSSEMVKLSVRHHKPSGCYREKALVNYDISFRRLHPHIAYFITKEMHLTLIFTIVFSSSSTSSSASSSLGCPYPFLSFLL